jgi:hypothetical protein
VLRLLLQLDHPDSRLGISQRGGSFHLALPDSRFSFFDHLSALDQLRKDQSISTYSFIESRGCFLIERPGGRSQIGLFAL